MHLGKCSAQRAGVGKVPVGHQPQLAACCQHPCRLLQQATAAWDDALELTAARLTEIRERHGPEAIGFLGSPLATNEENYLLQKVARAATGRDRTIGARNIDSRIHPIPADAAGRS